MDVGSEIILAVNHASEGISLDAAQPASHSALLGAVIDMERAFALLEDSCWFWTVVDQHVENWSRTSYAFDRVMVDDKHFAMASEIERRVLREGGLRDAVSDVLLASRQDALKGAVGASITPEVLRSATRCLKADVDVLQSKLADGPPPGVVTDGRARLFRLLQGIGGGCMAEISSRTMAAPGTIGLSYVGAAMWQHYGLALILYASTSIQW